MNTDIAVTKSYSAKVFLLIVTVTITESHRTSRKYNKNSK